MKRIKRGQFAVPKLPKLNDANVKNLVYANQLVEKWVNAIVDHMKSSRNTVLHKEVAPWFEQVINDQGEALASCYKLKISPGVKIEAPRALTDSLADADKISSADMCAAIVLFYIRGWLHARPVEAAKRDYNVLKKTSKKANFRQLMAKWVDDVNLKLTRHIESQPEEEKALQAVAGKAPATKRDKRKRRRVNLFMPDDDLTQTEIYYPNSLISEVPNCFAADSRVFKEEPITGDEKLRSLQLAVMGVPKKSESQLGELSEELFPLKLEDFQSPCAVVMLWNFYQLVKKPADRRKILTPEGLNRHTAPDEFTVLVRPERAAMLVRQAVMFYTSGYCMIQSGIKMNKIKRVGRKSSDTKAVRVNPHKKPKPQQAEMASDLLNLLDFGPGLEVGGADKKRPRMYPLAVPAAARKLHDTLRRYIGMFTPINRAALTELFEKVKGQYGIKLDVAQPSEDIYNGQYTDTTSDRIMLDAIEKMWLFTEIQNAQTLLLEQVAKSNADLGKKMRTFQTADKLVEDRRDDFAKYVELLHKTYARAYGKKGTDSKLVDALAAAPPENNPQDMEAAAREIIAEDEMREIESGIAAARDLGAKLSGKSRDTNEQRALDLVDMRASLYEQKLRGGEPVAEPAPKPKAEPKAPKAKKAKPKAKPKAEPNPDDLRGVLKGSTLIVRGFTRIFNITNCQQSDSDSRAMQRCDIFRTPSALSVLGNQKEEQDPALPCNVLMDKTSAASALLLAYMELSDYLFSPSPPLMTRAQLRSVDGFWGQDNTPFGEGLNYREWDGQHQRAFREAYRTQMKRWMNVGFKPTGQRHDIHRMPLMNWDSWAPGQEVFANPWRVREDNYYRVLMNEIVADMPNRLGIGPDAENIWAGETTYFLSENRPAPVCLGVKLYHTAQDLNRTEGEPSTAMRKKRQDMRARVTAAVADIAQHFNDGIEPQLGVSYYDTGYPTRPTKGLQGIQINPQCKLPGFAKWKKAHAWLETVKPPALLNIAHHPLTDTPWSSPVLAAIPSMPDQWFVYPLNRLDAGLINGQQFRSDMHVTPREATGGFLADYDITLQAEPRVWDMTVPLKELVGADYQCKQK